MKKTGSEIRIVIADDRTIFREGLKKVLSGQQQFQVIGETGNGKDACRLVEKLKPDALLLDMAIPKMSGTDVLKCLAESKSKTRAILLSGNMEDEEITKALELGARGVVLKDSTTAMLFKCIDTVIDGQYWIGDRAVGSLNDILKGQRKKEKEAHPKNFGLTPREMDVIRAAIMGASNKEIASLYAISEQTVKHHMTSIFDKLGVYNRLELTLFAFHHGLADK
jgi:DNA-binding NarL/FixJ family response regulator